MSAPAGTGCVYCGLPRGRVRGPRGGVLTLRACLPHADLLELDPAYSSDRMIDAELADLLERPSPLPTPRRRVRATALAAMPP